MATMSRRSEEEKGPAALRTNNEDTNPALRGSCDRCWKKKRRCPGGRPCPRCLRGSFACTYSPRRRLGRPHKRGCGDAAPRQRGPMGYQVVEEGTTPGTRGMWRRPTFRFRASSSTGLAGLPESQYLACFLEHCAPMCGFVDEVSVREGLVHVFLSRWDEDKASDSPPSTDMLLKSAATESTLFSSMAIGALLLGAPASAVSRHMTAARRTLTKCAGLRELPAVSALILCGLANALLPPVDGPAHEQRQQLQQQLMNNARAAYEELPAKDPLVNAFLTFRATNEKFMRLLPTGGGSVNPTNININVSGGQDGVSGSGGACTPRTKAAHPAYVVADTMTFILNKLSTTEDAMMLVSHEVCKGDSRTDWQNIHDFAGAALDRFVQEQAGVLVVATLAGALVTAKCRLGINEDLLPAAELTLWAFSKCPGLLRYTTCHAAHMAMTAFKLDGRRASYEAMRSLITNATEREIPSFDVYGVGIAICDLPICFNTSDILLEAHHLSPPSHGSSSAARGWPDGVEGLAGTEHVCQGEERHQSPHPPLVVAPTLHAVKNPDTAALPASDTDSISTTSTSNGNGQGEPAAARKRPLVVAGPATEDEEERACREEKQAPLSMSVPEAAWPACLERPGSMLRGFSHDGGARGVGSGLDSGDGLERVGGQQQHQEEEEEQQQRDRLDIDASLREVRGGGLGLGVVEQACGAAAAAAAGAGPRYGSTDTSELGVMDGRWDGGGGWAGQRGQEGYANNHTCGAELGKGGAGVGDGGVSRSGYLSLDSHQLHERGGQPAPFIFGDVGSVVESSCTEAAATMRHHHHHELCQDREARSIGVAAAGGVLPCASGDHQHMLSRSLEQSAGGGGGGAAASLGPEVAHYPRKLGGYPHRCEALQEDGVESRSNSCDMAVFGGSGANWGSGDCVGPSHELERRNGAQPPTYGGEEQGGGGTQESSDLASLLLED